jgi:hypothetical protein
VKIRIFGHSGEIAFPFGDGPWNQFRNVFEACGHTIIEGNLTEPADAVVAHSHGDHIEKYMRNFRVPKERRALVIWEPRVVDPGRYQNKVLENYGFTFAPSKDWASQVSAIPFKWPQDLWSDNFSWANWSLRKKKVVIVQANKFSALSGEMYSLRRKVVKALEDDVELYGKDWNRGMRFGLLAWLRSALRSSGINVQMSSISLFGQSFQNYHGPCENKISTISNYQVSIVIENSLDYVSEKLFDSVNAGCITLYVGPDIEKYDLPKDAVIQLKPNVAEIVETTRMILQLDSKESKRLAQNQRASLKKVWQSWDNRDVLAQLARDILMAFSCKN